MTTTNPEFAGILVNGPRLRAAAEKAEHTLRTTDSALQRAIADERVRAYRRYLMNAAYATGMTVPEMDALIAAC